MQKRLLICVVCLLGIAVLVAIGLTLFNKGIGEVLALQIGSIDFTSIPDGTYGGSYTQNRWSYTVQVKVKTGIMQDITITHSNHEKIVGATNKKIIQEILQKQSLNIQGVSGATVSTKALQKSVENALKTAL